MTRVSRCHGLGCAGSSATTSFSGSFSGSASFIVLVGCSGHHQGAPAAMTDTNPEPETIQDQDAEPSLNAPEEGRPDGVDVDDDGD